MMDLLIFTLVYSMCVGFFLYIRYPKTKFICPECDNIKKGYAGDTCKCGYRFGYTDRASDTRLMLKRFEQYGLIKKIDMKEK